MTSPLWPAQMHHFRLNSAQPERLVEWYGKAAGMAARKAGDGLWHMAGPQRRMLIGEGADETVDFVAFALDDADRLAALQARLKDLPLEESPSPLFGNAAFAVRDPDGLLLVFGVPLPGHDEHATKEGIAGRTQHIVFASTDPVRQQDFYGDKLGFVTSDEVRDGDKLMACFLRSDPEHHSYATFRADGARFDHQALECAEWNDIRDWSDHLSTMRVPIWWGPGRHGPGNNLFAMVRDPDGNRLEFSAELEVFADDDPTRTWPHEEYTLNLWGSAWMRS